MVLLGPTKPENQATVVQITAIEKANPFGRPWNQNAK
jgi:hypothetical protein